MIRRPPRSPLFPTRRSSDLIETRGVPIGHRGEPHVLYIGRDITERRRAEEALRASEEQYRAVFNATADRKSTRLNSSHMSISYAVFCLKKKKTRKQTYHPLS